MDVSRLERGFERTQRVVAAGLDRAHRYTQLLSDVGLLELAPIGQLQHLAVRLRQRIEGITHPEADDEPVHLVVGGRRRRPGLRRPRRRTSPQVYRQAPGDRENERPRRSAGRVVTTHVAPQPYERFLNQLLSQATVAEQLHPEPVDPPG